VTLRETPERLLSLRETQDVLGLSRATVYRLVSAGLLPVVVLPGRTLVQASDLRDFIDSRKTTRSGNGRGPAGRPSLVTTSADGDGGRDAT
jgi:predicted DNA-binding transcriptional regulator AlpA